MTRPIVGSCEAFARCTPSWSVPPVTKALRRVAISTLLTVLPPSIAIEATEKRKMWLAWVEKVAAECCGEFEFNFTAAESLLRARVFLFLCPLPPLFFMLWPQNDFLYANGQWGLFRWALETKKTNCSILRLRSPRAPLMFSFGTPKTLVGHPFGQH